MPDKLFYPFAVLVIAAMIAAALMAGGGKSGLQQPDVNPEVDGFTLEGDALRALVASPGTTVDYAQDQQLAGEYSIAAAHMLRREAPPSAGVFAELGPVYEAAFAENNLKITVRARAGQDRPAQSFTVNYYSVGSGDSTPQTFTPTDEFQDYSFNFRPNAPRGDPGTDFVGVWPDVAGKSGAIEIERIRVEIVSE